MTGRPKKPWEVGKAAGGAFLPTLEEVIRAEEEEARELRELVDDLETLRTMLRSGEHIAGETRRSLSEEVMKAEAIGISIDGDTAALSFRRGEEIAAELRKLVYIDAEGGADELGRMGLRWVERGGKNLIIGEQAEVLARLFGRGLKSPMREGLLKEEDEESATVICDALREVQEGQAGAVVVVLPDVPEEARERTGLVEAALRQLLGQAGRDVTAATATEATARATADARGMEALVHVGSYWSGVGLLIDGQLSKKWAVAEGVERVFGNASQVTGIPKERLRQQHFSRAKEEGFRPGSTAVQLFQAELFGMIAKGLAAGVGEVRPEPAVGAVRLSGAGATLPAAEDDMKRGLAKAGVQDRFPDVKIFSDPVTVAARGGLLLAEDRLAAKTRANA